ncbi:STAS domain-containing protein [Bacillus sp. FJAT-44742]|uniref:STAS domain-containing protein n=1 Tax=Bacillus sp. FJAT-44742 TaxID=2014005 RepID=UPI000C23160C|nr:STAS domain-containing protein [Bacillus sp. FJAT-44742]
MNTTNIEALQEYLENHAGNIVTEWQQIASKKSGTGEIFSNQEKDFYKNDEEFVRTASQGLLEETNFKDWTERTAAKRIKLGTPLNHSLQKFKTFRMLMNKKVQDFVSVYSSELSPIEVLTWIQRLDQTLDEAAELFIRKYQDFDTEKTEAQQQVILDLSVPIIPISDSIGVLPIIGEIDTYRAKIIQEQALKKSSDLEIEHLIIDVSGVPFMDTMVAHEIFQLHKTLTILGIETIITGIRPEIAQTAVHLGIKFNGLTTYAHLKQAVFTLLEDKKK